MVDIPIGPGSYDRRVPKEAIALLKNRFYEQNPMLNDAGSSVIARPGLKKWIEVGDGHIRKVYSQPGAFNDDLFVVSGLNLWRVDRFGVASDLGQISTDPVSSVSMAATGNIGSTPAFLFIAEGGVLWVYSEDGPAIGHLEATGAIANNDTISIGGIYYKWTNAGVDVGTPDGSSGNPWLVLFTGVNSTSLDAMYKAINFSGTSGVDYSTALSAENEFVFATSVAANDLFVIARESGSGGNSIVVTETGANLTWGSGMTGGGTESLRQVEVPDDKGAISVAHVNSFVIVIPVQDDDPGRFFWIEPGETFIDPLNFATAERSPDPVTQVAVFSDMFWLFGKDTTEAWITTGNADAPMQRFQGILYDRGQWEGTAVQVKDSLIVIDPDGGVFQIKGGQERISRPDIEEKIRRAIQAQAFSIV